MSCQTLEADLENSQIRPRGTQKLPDRAPHWQPGGRVRWPRENWPATRRFAQECAGGTRSVVK